MRGFKRKLSVIMVIAMILALIPGAGAREIAAWAAEKVEGQMGLDYVGVGYDGVLYRERRTGGAYKVTFATASNATEFMKTANGDPDSVIQIEVVDEEEKSVEGVEIAWRPDATAYSYKDFYYGNVEEDDPNVIFLRYFIDVGKDAPDSAIIKTTVGGFTDTKRIEIRDIPTPEKKLTVSGRKSVEVGKKIRIAVTADSEDALNFLEVWSDDEKKDQDWENVKDWKSCYEGAYQTGSTMYFDIIGLNEGTSTYEFYIGGSEEETKTTVEITVKPRTMMLTESEIELSVNEWRHIEIDDSFGVEDICYKEEVYVDPWLFWYNLGEEYHPVISISDPTVARLIQRHDENDTRWFSRWDIEALKEGTATITVEWLGAKAEAVLTVTGLPLQQEINRIIDDYLMSHPELRPEGEDGQPIPAADLNSIISKISEMVKDKALTDRVWNESMNYLNGECGWYVNAYDYMLLHESANIVGLFERVQYFCANMTIPDQIPGDGEWNQFWVTMDDAAEADVNAVSGTGKTGFVIGFKEGILGTDEKDLKPITELKVPVRITLAIPEDLVDASDLAVYYVDGSAKKLDAGYVVRRGDSLLVQVDQPGTYVLAEPYKVPSSSGGSSYGYSSGSSSKATASYIPGWVQNETGWWYRYSDGTWPANAWAQLAYNGRTDWYHFDANGYMQTGWFTDTDGRIYYLNPVSDGWMGSMFVGSHVIDGKTYYFNEADDGHQGALVQ